MGVPDIGIMDPLVTWRSSIGRALALGARGCWFKSSRRDFGAVAERLKALVSKTRVQGN